MSLSFSFYNKNERRCHIIDKTIDEQAIELPYKCIIMAAIGPNLLKKRIQEQAGHKVFWNDTLIRLECEIQFLNMYEKDMIQGPFKSLLERMKEEQVQEERKER